MARESDDKTKYIKYVFPKDSTQLDSILSVNEGKKNRKRLNESENDLDSISAVAADLFRDTKGVC